MGTKYIYKIHNSLSFSFSEWFGFELFRKRRIYFKNTCKRKKTIFLTKLHVSEESVKCTDCLCINENVWNDFFKAWNGTIVVF